MKKIISLIMSATIMFTAVVQEFVIYTDSYSADSVINVDEHTPEEIKQYIDSHHFSISARNKFTVEPSAEYPYSAGVLDDETLYNALDALNCMRYIAGLPEVSLNSEYNELAQYASLVNCVNNFLTHYPEQPDDMPDEMYELGRKGASSSNITGGNSSHTLAYSVLLYMNDSDSSNLSRIGHRRWCLNPDMQETGFGLVDRYSAMYSIDKGRTDAIETGVCWPAQNMPVEYFKSLISYYNSPAWSISMGMDLNESDIKVSLIRKSDLKEWNFSSTSADGDFYVNNDNIGQKGCIIFSPSDISYSAGDVFDVRIEGMEEPVEYSVSFFSLSDIPGEWTTYSLGDVNGDGFINSLDASNVLTEYSLLSVNQTGILNDEQRKAADINSDGLINTGDASMILSFYSYISTTADNISMEEWLLL